MKIQESKRLSTIDVAKGIGIILVVFAHVNYTPGLLKTIYSFHMPLFFLISGMMYRKDRYTSFSQFLYRKVQTLICPYVFFYMLALVLEYGVKLLSGGFAGFQFSEFLDHFVQMFISQGSAKVVSAPLWFVLCLFAVEILYYFVAKCKTPVIVIICVLFAFAGWLLELDHFPYKGILPWSLDSAFFALGFYAIGNLTFGYVKALLNVLTQKKMILIACIATVGCFAVTVLLAFTNGNVSLGSKNLNNGFIFYLTGIIGSMGILLLSSLLQNNRFLSYLGRNSFCIMAVHCLVKSIYFNVLKIVGIPLYDNTNLVQTIFPFLLVMALSIVVTLVYNKLKGLFIPAKARVCQ